MRHPYFIAVVVIFLFGCVQPEKPEMEKPEEQGPSPAEQYVSLAWDYYQKGEYGTAKQMAREAISHDPNYMDAYTLLADIFFKLDQPDSAGKVYERLIKLDPVRGNYGIGLHYLKKGDAEKALKYFEAAIKANKKCAYAYYGAACAYEKLGDKDKAYEALCNAVKYAPDKVDYRVMLGKMCYECKEFDKAINELEAARKLKPDDPNINYLLGVAYFSAKEFEKAREPLEFAIKFMPNNVELHMKLGTVYEELDNDSFAIVEYKKVLELENNYIPAYKRLVNILIERKEFDKAEELLKEARELAADDPLLACLAGDVHFSRARKLFTEDYQKEHKVDVLDIITKEIKAAYKEYEVGKNCDDPEWEDYAEKAISSLKDLEKQVKDAIWWEKGKKKTGD